MLERLESRRLFTVSLSLDGAGVLRITGTSADENLQVFERANIIDPSGRVRPSPARSPEAPGI